MTTPDSVLAETRAHWQGQPSEQLLGERFEAGKRAARLSFWTSVNRGCMDAVAVGSLGWGLWLLARSSWTDGLLALPWLIIAMCTFAGRGLYRGASRHETSYLATLDFMREQLERQRDFALRAASWRGVVPAAGILFLTIAVNIARVGVDGTFEKLGYALGIGMGLGSSIAALLLVYLFSRWFQGGAAARYQREIDELDGR
jgi:hypothetical protein